MAAVVAITTTLGAITAFAAKPPSAAKPPGVAKPSSGATPPGKDKPPDTPNPHVGEAGGGPRFTLSGNVDGLWPGAQRTLVVTAENPYPFDIVLTSLNVGVAAASASCPASVLHISSPAADVRIAARGRRAVELVASLDPDAPDGCQGAIWTLSYTASARRA
jgi:hypothetical protein